MVQLTADAIKAWGVKHRDLAHAVMKARVLAKMERERVDAYITPIFVRYQFRDEGDGTVLTDPRRSYLAGEDERFAAYWEECERAHREHGYKGEVGTCPALVAESLQVRAENLLLDAFAIFLGADDGGGGHTFYALDLRERALDLALTTCFGTIA